MLRFIVLLLLLANGAYYAWASGFLQDWGYGPVAQREPQRLSQQVRPEAVRVIGADEARRLETSTRPVECLQAGPIDEAAVEPLRQALASWPSGRQNPPPVSASRP